MAANPTYTVESDDGETVRIRETFDLTAPGCPAIVYRFGTWPLEKVADAVEAGRIFPMPRQQAVDLGLIP